MSSRHTRHHFILVYQPSYFAPVQPPAAATAAWFPLKNILLILSRNKICIQIYGLPPATQPSYHATNGSQQPLCFVTVCTDLCAVTVWVKIPSENPWGNFLSLFYPFVVCPTSCSLISFPDPQTPAALMWHHRFVYLAGTSSWIENRWSLAVWLKVCVI